ncbi:MAG: DUF4357 domain-containing protein [Eubacteriales bacterium]|nr:DUF4357 domain-containing protein [Eubacteriales bacterium]
MKIYLKNKSCTYSAEAIFNMETRETVVCKGSKISNTIAHGKFRSAKSIEKLRNSGCVNNGILVEDISFKSASSAANFVTGTSTNGMTAWKNENGLPLNECLK